MKPILSLEETMNQLKARLGESEYKYAVVCEALENLLDEIDSRAYNNYFYDQMVAGRQALLGVVDSD